MKIKVLGYCLLSSFLLWGLYACMQDETYTSSSNKATRFFDVSGLASTHIQEFAINLQLKNDSAEFVPQFIDTYGYPMWKKAVTFLTNDAQVYLVPIRSQGPNDEIKAIWYFTINSNRTHYNIYTRKMADVITRQLGDEIEQTWIFDYFTQNALHRKPASGLFFRDVTPEVKTKSPIVWITCTEMYITIDGINGPEGTEHVESVTAHKGTRCVIDAYEGFDNGSGSSDGSSGDFGGGGGGSGSGNGDRYTDPPSPCDKAQRLSLDAAFKSKVNELFHSVQNYHSGDTENGWIKTTTGEYIYPITREEGSMSYNPSNLKGKNITEEYHSHPTGACFPSWSDLKVLATRLKNGQIDVNNFSYGVVCSMGCLSMMITSEDAFKTFTNKVLNNDKSLFNNYNVMHSMNNKGVDMQVAKFIDFLKSSASGLDVMFNQTSYDSNVNPSLGNWTAKSSNGNANLSNYNCK